MEEKKTKDYEYELVEERKLSLIIRVWTKKKDKFYDFAIPKSVIEEYVIYEEVPISTKKVKNVSQLKRKKMVRITIEPYLMYKFTWLKIQKYMQNQGIPVKTWNKKYKYDK